MNHVRIHRAVLLFIFLVSVIFHRAFAATILLQPVADTTLIEIAPISNMGGSTFVNAGTAGQNGARNRGLYKFNFSSIPPYSKIKSAAVTLEVVQEPSAGGVSSLFDLHRLLKSWGEGDKVTALHDGGGLGLLATTNEATWNSRFAFTTNLWSSPGASNDYATAVSSSTPVYGVADFPHFNSTPQMIADVQDWVNDPASNFGWLLKSESEATAKTARGFGSREFAGADVNSPPYVAVEFVPPPTIFGLQITNSQFKFSFTAESNQAYVVEFKNVVVSTNSWLALTNIVAPIASTNILVSDTVSTNARFYRVVAP